MSNLNLTPPEGPRTGSWGRLGGQLGIGLCALGFIVMFLGWNGAAGTNVSMAQFPYLISGGMVGLGLVVIGAAMIVVQSAREDRARMEATLERLTAALEAGGGAGRAAAAAAPVSAELVLAGANSYHRLDCSLAEAREEARTVTLDDAARRQLTACRVCRPAVLTG